MVSRGALQPQPFWESLKGGLTCVERDLVDRRHAESGEHRNGNGANCMGMWTALSVGTRMHRARGWGLSKVWGRCKHVTGMAPSTEVGTSVSVELVTALSMSTGFIWVKSLHRSLYGAMVWICDQNSVGVLVSAGTELTFFLVAGTVLCFGFSVRMMLITLRCFSCC